MYNAHIVHINSTSQGGGVAEILNSLVPLMNDIGLNAGWRVLHGNFDFFTLTKKIHNALQGESINLSKHKKDLYTKTNQNFSVFTHINHECVIIHDPQPLPLSNFYQKKQPWVWRCHIDLSHPNKTLWNYLKKFTLKYDMVIVSHEDYKKEDLPVEQRIIHPAIDPLTSKNMELTKRDIDRYVKKFNIKRDKPILCQISRFDKWKDPLGVIDVFKMVKEQIDCRLILCGNMASDDPEGMQIFEKVKRKAGKMLETGDIILITLEDNVLVNVLQRISNVIIQKSIREGFGLTVTEALWKGTPVVASNKGGIPLQVINEFSGFTLDPQDKEGFADKIIFMLENPEIAEQYGKNGREHVRKNFLTTRLLLDYLNLLKELL
jgi:trehalose synthase